MVKQMLSAALLAACASHSLADYREHSEAQAFMHEMQAQNVATEAQLDQWFASAKKQQSILEAIARPAEKTLTWAQYAKIFLTGDRIQKGVDFWREHKDTLARAEQTYGVPAAMIVAIIGVETRYGRTMGNYRVLDALSTLAFDYPPRASFFRKELQHFLQLTQEQKQDPLLLKGSYAGAMGYGQFMPSSFRHYAVDFDGDEIADIWANPVDAIGSVANYFAEHGWQTGQPVTTRVRVSDNFDASLLNTTLKPDTTTAAARKAGFSPVLELPDAEPLTLYKLDGEHGAEFWAGTQNYYVITRYNRSRMYALAAYQLSQAIERKYSQ
ncbi:lytic murein transglycosylase B [Simiduia aestuariiviva]|uniref:Membrane-bound lytic murein transglycosylase B n=1 Tax=Simiduia aestuariiviva TaxID=1510459 RepID=A0A839UTI6_9GAMM|nr:lytic murein transglycosylase B [Simiduia aestuariiviva]MBB3169276.1 membrane-bound lytic murein transglycosylase B [Simiduia aestuariiviva]